MLGGERMSRTKLIFTDEEIDRFAEKIAYKLKMVDKALDQYRWERDVAISQLEKLGIGFAEKIDGVYLSIEEYKGLCLQISMLEKEIKDLKNEIK